MKVLVIMHEPSEGPGTRGDFLGFKRAEIVPVKLYAGDSVPKNSDGYDAIVTREGR